jgi:circadian clock protein KaiC
MIDGGIPERSMTMLVGPSGTGKTTAGLQFLAQSSGEEPGLLFSFYETPARIRAKARMFPPFVEALDAGNIEILWQPPSEWILDQLAIRLIEAVRRRNVRRLLLDGLAGFKKALRSRPMEPFFTALVEELCSVRVTTICTAEATEIIGPTITAPLGGLSDATDNHILLRFIESGASLYRILSILKVRDSSFDSNLREFSITDHGIEISQDSASAELVLASLRRQGPSDVNIRENK